MTVTCGAEPTDDRNPIGPHAAAVRLHAAAVSALAAHLPMTAHQRQLRRAFLRHLRAHPDAVLKHGPPAHLTASCVVLDPSGEHVLLTHHRRARRWFQFGGHLEPGDAGVHAAATREAREESGLPTLTPLPQIVELDRHVLVGDFGTCREHLDVRYLALVDREAAPQASAESLQVRWWPVTELPEGPEGELARLVRVARRAMQSS